MNYLALDIGGTDVKIGIVSDQGTVLKKTSVRADFDHYKTPLLKTALNGAEAFIRECAAQKGLAAKDAAEAVRKLELGGIGISATGVINKNGGFVAGAGAHIPNYLGAQIKKEFESLFQLETRVINDANSVAVAEHWNGSAKGADNALILTIGTGIGGGVITGGKILEGAHGFAGEVGRLIIQKDGDPGIYESYGSTKALVKRAAERYQEAGEKISEDSFNGKRIFTDAAAGNQTALDVIDEWIRDIAAGIISLIYIFDPEVIVIGGGVSAQKELLIDPLEQKVRQGLMPVFAKKVTIIPATHGNDAGMIGAVCSFTE